MSFDKCDAARKVNAYITEYIKFADAKAGAILAFVSAIAGGVSVASLRVLNDGRHFPAWYLCGSMLLLASDVVAISICAWHLLNAISPRLARVKVNGFNKKCMVSFPDIAKVSSQEVEGAFHELTEDKLISHYARHNAALSRIANTKFESITASVSCLYFVVIISLAVVIAVSIGTLIFGAHPTNTQH